MRRNETAGRKKYEAPTVTRTTAMNLSPNVRGELGRMISEIRSEGPEFPKSNGEFRIELTLEGRFKKVSEEFCILVGYTQSALLGRKIDDVTMCHTIHIPHHLGAVAHFGCFHCLWLFARGDGRAVLVRTDWELLPDLTMEVYGVPLRVNA